MKPRIVAALIAAAAAARLLALHFLHPLNWDELEFFRAAVWIAEGRVPFRDFWEHHTPLVWYLFAPFTLLSDSTGIAAIVPMRWLQVPVWIVTFWLTNLWMRNLGIDAFARWSAMALAVTSSLFMLPATEFRIEAVPCALFMAGAVLAQRGRYFLAGVCWCLVGMANLRFGPLVVVFVLLLLFTRDGRWGFNRRALWIIPGGLAMLAGWLAFFAATGSLDELYQQVWVDNQAERYYQRVPGRFVHRLLVPFGIRLIATDRLFELAAVDAGGAALLILGGIGVAFALLRLRRPDELFVLALPVIANLAFIARMKFVYNYHFAIVVITAIPFIAALFARVTRRGAIVALLVVTTSVNVFAAVFRGKELDFAYQDVILREMHARTPRGEQVFSGAAWPFRREPAYRFWFLPELVGQMVRHGEGPRYALEEAVANPPAVVVFDHNTWTWLTVVQRELAPYFVRHYVPVWRELWVPGMNVSLRPGASLTWIVPRDGAYRVYVSAPLARHPWFRDPLRTASYKGPDASRLTFRLPEPGAGPVTFDADPSRLRKGQRLTATNTSGEQLAVFVLPSNDRMLFRQPPPGATLEAETTRVTHVPRLWR